MYEIYGFVRKSGAFFIQPTGDAYFNGIRGTPGDLPLPGVFAALSYELGGLYVKSLPFYRN